MSTVETHNQESPFSKRNYSSWDFLIFRSRQAATDVVRRLVKISSDIRIDDLNFLKESATINPQVESAVGVDNSSPETYAFDLGRERELIQQYGENYWPYFKSNFQTFINERYGHLQKTEYDLELVKNGLGQWKIYFDRAGNLINARDSFNISALDPELPDWYRYRCLRDVAWVEATEGILNSNSRLVRLIEFSHAPYHIPEAEREKLGFGKQSFLRVYEVEGQLEVGRARLHATAVRHYLALDEQYLLRKLLTGVDSTDALLGFSGEVGPSSTIGKIEDLIDQLYEQTPPERKIIPNQEDQVQLTEEQTRVYFDQSENWLRGIFLMLNDLSFEEADIETEFTALRLTLRDVVYGRITDLNWLEGLTPEGFYQKKYLNLVQLQERKKVTEEKEGSDCPGKAGFRRRTVFEMRFESQKAYWRVSLSDRVHFFDDCPVCGKENINRVVKMGDKYPCCGVTRTC